MSSKSITEIDQNLAAVEVQYAGMSPRNINEPPFRLYGACREDGEQDFKRMPHAVAHSVDNESVQVLYLHTSGLRLRFRTDSQRIILRCTWKSRTVFDHMPMTGSSCFDLYADGVYTNVFRPGSVPADTTPIPLENGYESCFTFPTKAMRDILINFPLYNDISSLNLYLEIDAQVLPGDFYTYEKPVLFYGSSITQGGCASHPGNCYSHIISRRLDTNFINLGFSGGCRAELEMAEYIANLDMSVFVYDYDHNSASAEYLEQTHERLFKIVRQRQPELPILMVSVADQTFGDQTDRRKAIIRKTYENAVAAGDKHVYFLDGQTIYQEVGLDYCTVDGCHPNDLGFWCMANAIGEIVKTLL